MKRILRSAGNCSTVAIPPLMLEYLDAKEGDKIEISYGQNKTVILKKEDDKNG